MGSQSMPMMDGTGAIRDIYYENQNGYAVAEGDIILGKLSKNKGVFASLIPELGGTRWVDGKIPYTLATDLPQETAQLVRQAMSLWQEKSGVQFIPLTPENQTLYTDYLYIQPVEGTTCSSSVGRKGGEQVIILASRCNAMSIVHELGHTLGLWHEQSRIDRDQYVQIVWENISEEHQSNFNQHLTNSVDFGAYNYDSIMHYSALAFSKNGEKTIIPFQEGVIIGQRDHISDGDIAAVKMMYHKNK